MYALTDQQIDFILNDIKLRGVEMEDLQLNLLDHICCIIECEFKPDDDFETFYQKLIPRFFKKELKEIEEETVLLLTFKNYYAMKKTMIRTGIISVTAFITGSLFKVMHWPGASVLLVLGIGILSLIFLPLLFILKTKDSGTTRDKLIIAVASLLGIVLCMAVLFSVMHWPGGQMFWFTATAVSFFIFIPVYFFTGIRNPETKLNTIVTTIILIGATGLLFTMINTRPAKQQLEVKMYTYLQSEQVLSMIQNHLNDSVVSSSEKNKLSAEINNNCEKIKSLILQNAIGQTSLPKDFEEQGILIEEGNLGTDFFDNGEGIKLFSNLKEAIDKYNTVQKNETNKISIDHFQIAKIGLYNNFVVLNYVVQLQMCVAAAENKLTACK